VHCSLMERKKIETIFFLFAFRFSFYSHVWLALGMHDYVFRPCGSEKRNFEDRDG